MPQTAKDGALTGQVVGYKPIGHQANRAWRLLGKNYMPLQQLLIPGDLLGTVKNSLLLQQ